MLQTVRDESRRRYQAPVLTDFGDAAKLTRQSSGSTPVAPVAAPVSVPAPVSPFPLCNVNPAFC